MRGLIAALIVCLLAPGPARAAVEIAFYSRDVDVNFPHAFVTLKGTIDATGEPVDANYGFTPKHVSPAVLVGSVGGKVVSVDAAYVALSNRHFVLVLSDEQYRAVMAEVEAWSAHPQPSYNLNRRNCVNFVADLAEAAGIDGSPQAGLMKKPHSFLDRLRARNATLIAERAASAPAPSAEAAPAGR